VTAAAYFRDFPISVIFLHAFTPPAIFGRRPLASALFYFHASARRRFSLHFRFFQKSAAFFKNSQFFQNFANFYFFSPFLEKFITLDIQNCMMCIPTKIFETLGENGRIPAFQFFPMRYWLKILKS
jgi:hypothetical protein